MKIGVMVQEGPYQHQASDSAWEFVRAALARGHEVVGVFFYTDGVYNVNRFMNPPGERVIAKRWSELGAQGIPLVACVTDSTYRGITQEIAVPNAKISGLGNLAEFIQQADRFVTFGD
ncbi:MAG: sulfurtransferase complex subunit TusD [candidate division NC10 bacterium]